MKLLNEIKNKIIEFRYFLIMIIIVILLTFIRLPYYIELPGGIFNLDNKIVSPIKIETSGSINMAYVTEIKATIPTYLLSLINKNWDLEKISDVISSNETEEEQNYRNKMLLKEANSTATIVAYNKANKNLEIASKKLYITYIDPVAKTTLKIKDQIIKIDNNKINNQTDLKKIINEHNVNDIIEIETNNGIKTATIYEENNKKYIGVMISIDYEINNNIKFKFDKSESGPSGGLMMSLCLYNYLTNDSLTKGRTIAGTGTIDLNGEVGEISGVKYKLMGAAKNNVEIFLVPTKNYKEALKVKKENNYKIDIYPVRNIDEAINYLKKE